MRTGWAIQTYDRQAVPAKGIQDVCFRAVGLGRLASRGQISSDVQMQFSGCLEQVWQCQQAYNMYTCTLKPYRIPDDQGIRA